MAAEKLGSPFVGKPMLADKAILRQILEPIPVGVFSRSRAAQLG